MFCAPTSIVRTEWSFELASVCQRFACDVLDPEPEQLTQAVDVLASSLPVPESQAESFTLRDRLFATTQIAAHQFHAQFHRLIPHCNDCGWSFRRGALNWDNFDLQPSQFLTEWVSSYLQDFAKSHEWPAPVRAARVIRSSLDKPLDVERIARTVGSARSGLIRCFKDVYGITMSDYHARCRIQRALAILREPDSNVATAAFEVGYRSTKNFYRALRHLTGMTPSQLRELSDEDADALLNTVLRLPSPAFAKSNGDLTSGGIPAPRT